MKNTGKITNPYTPIAVGFLLLSIPLVISIALSETNAGRWTNALAAIIMVGFGMTLLRRKP